jgi:hypothetical protein
MIAIELATNKILAREERHISVENPGKISLSFKHFTSLIVGGTTLLQRSDQ